MGWGNSLNPDELQWWEFDTPQALYLTWRRHDGTWAGLEFLMSPTSSSRRNETFIKRHALDVEPQWVSASLEEAQAMIRQMVLGRARLTASMQGAATAGTLGGVAVFARS